MQLWVLNNNASIPNLTFEVNNEIVGNIETTIWDADLWGIEGNISTIAQSTSSTSKYAKAALVGP